MDTAGCSQPTYLRAKGGRGGARRTRRPSSLRASVSIFADTRGEMTTASGIDDVRLLRSRDAARLL